MEHVRKIFDPHDTEFYYVELTAPQAVRLARNCTENRLKNKASKRNIDWSNKLLLRDDERYRCVSMEGEIPYSNYLRIDNSEISAGDAAVIIKEHFGL